MNFQGKAVLVYLEEDNIARAYFRIQPLMTQEGTLNADTAAAFPDDGFLRIVPDKNEQHTFKERMRSLCGLCVMDLRFLPTEANKIRTNKNYSPARGESNQYIVYSDAVRALPEDLLYQVVAEGDVQGAATPLVYTRSGAHIQGPFRRENGQPQGETVQLPPDSTEIHAVTLGNGQELLFYWPRQAEPLTPAAPIQPVSVQETPAPQTAVVPAVPAEAEVSAYDQIQELNTELSERANRLDTAPAPRDFLPEPPQKPLTGTRLYQAPLRPAAPRRAHNPLMETVEQQRYAARYEAPGAVLPQSAQLREVQNPMDALKRALQEVWRLPETQRQAADVLLAQPGMRTLLSKTLAAGKDDLTVAAMHSQLQELEAERLMTLMQLDDARKNLAAARETALGQLKADEQKSLDVLRDARQKAQAELETLNAALPALEEKRQEAEAWLNAARKEGAPAVIAAPVGRPCAKADLLARVEKQMKAAGFSLEKGDALSLLVSFAVCPRLWQINSDTEADAYAAIRAFAQALGSPVAAVSYHDGVAPLPGGDTPVFLLNGCEGAERHRLLFSIFAYGAANGEDAVYADEAPYPCVPVYQSLDAMPRTIAPDAPVSLDCLRREMLTDTPLSTETLEELTTLRRAIADQGAALPLTLVHMMGRYLAATQNDLPGGVAEALDRAVCLFVVPHLLHFEIELADILPLLAAMPRALKALKKA